MTVTSDSNKNCENCIWVDIFTPREDELRMGFVLGCKKPGWEGYTSPLKMACDGVFWSEKAIEKDKKEIEQ